jgi:hypothetical protein
MRLLFAPLLVLCFFAVSGCGPQDLKQKTYPVKGTVLVDGKPLANAMIVFHPEDMKNFKMDERPQGKTDAQGRFELFTYVMGDGAPAASYKVAIKVVQTSDDGGSDQFKREKGAMDAPQNYWTKEKSPISVTVKPEPNELEPFNLKR